MNPSNFYTIDSEGDTVYAIEAVLMYDQVSVTFPEAFRVERDYTIYVINVTDTSGNLINPEKNFAIIEKPYISKMDSLRSE